MRLLLAPLFWLSAGALALAFQAYTGSSRFGARLPSDWLAEVQRANSNRVMNFPILLTGLFCTYAAIRALINGADAWWLWFLAAAAHFGVLAIRRRAGDKPGAGEVQPSVQVQPNLRWAVWFFLPAVACLYAAKPVAESAVRLDDWLIGAAAILLMIVAMTGFIGAGWSVVWVSSRRKSDKMLASPPHS